jgi:hypothetical protein
MSRASLLALAAVLALGVGKASANVTELTSIYFTDDAPMIWPDMDNSIRHTLVDWSITDGTGNLHLTNKDLGSSPDEHTYTFGVSADPYVTTILDLTNMTTVDWIGYDITVHAPVNATVSFVSNSTYPYSSSAWSVKQIDQQNTVIHFSGPDPLGPNETTELGYKIWINEPTSTSVSYCVTGTPILAPEAASLLLLAPAAMGLLARRRR